MVKFENVAKEFLGGKASITLPPRDEYKDEWDFDLQLTEEDKIDLVDAIRRSESEPEKTKEILKEQDELIRKILQRSYPDMDEESINSVVLNRSTEIILELSFKFGIRDRKAYEAILKKREDEIKKMTGSDSQPEKEAE